MFNKGYILCKDQYEFDLINYWIKFIQNKLKANNEIVPVVASYERTFTDLQSGSLLPKNIKLAEGTNADVIFVCFGSQSISWSNIIPVGIDQIEIMDIPEISKIYTQKILKTRLTNLFKDPKTVINIKSYREADKLGTLLDALGFCWGNHPDKKYTDNNFIALRESFDKSMQIRTSTGTRAEKYPQDKFNTIEFDSLLTNIGFDENGKLIK